LTSRAKVRPQAGLASGTSHAPGVAEARNQREHEMKPLLLSGAAIVALGATAALAAPPQVSGNIGFFVGADWTNLDVSTSTQWQGDDTVFIFGGDGHVNAWLSRDMSIQFDVQSEATTTIYQGDNSSGEWDGRTGGIVGAHLSWRETQS